jgi:hypothetical protein
MDPTSAFVDVNHRFSLNRRTKSNTTMKHPQLIKLQYPKQFHGLPARYCRVCPAISSSTSSTATMNAIWIVVAIKRPGRPNLPFFLSSFLPSFDR